MASSTLLRRYALPIGGTELESLARQTTERAADSPSIDAALCESLAREFQVPVRQVEAAYREELCRLAFGARVTTFLGVLATRRVRARLGR